MMLLETKSKEIIVKEIENLIISGCDVIDSVLSVSLKYNIDEELISKYLTVNLLEKIKIEAIEKNYIKKEEPSLDDFT